MQISCSHWGIHESPATVALPIVPTIEMMKAFVNNISVKEMQAMSDDFIAAYRLMCKAYTDTVPKKV